MRGLPPCRVRNWRGAGPCGWARLQFLPIRTTREVFPQAAHPTRFCGTQCAAEMREASAVRDRCLFQINDKEAVPRYKNVFCRGYGGCDTEIRDLNRSTTNIPSACRIANIAINDAMILPYDANPARMEFSERTGRAIPTATREIAFRSPWQNAYVERLIGSIRRECLDHMIVFGEAHLRRILGAYAAYYNEPRTHRSLNKDAPFHRAIERRGAITSHPILGGLHHQYCRI